jgi:hypothetical protein
MRDLAYEKKRNHLVLIQEHSVPSISVGDIGISTWCLA